MVVTSRLHLDTFLTSAAALIVISLPQLSVASSRLYNIELELHNRTAKIEPNPHPPAEFEFGA
jgi:hypothetical protein